MTNDILFQVAGGILAVVASVALVRHLWRATDEPAIVWPADKDMTLRRLRVLMGRDPEGTADDQGTLYRVNR